MKKIISKIITAIFILSAILYVFSSVSREFATRINSSICQTSRDFLRAVTDLFGVSVFEVLVIISPILFIAAVIYIARANGKNIHRRFLFIITLALIIPTNYFLTLGIGYKAETINTNKESYTAEQLYETARLLISDIEGIKTEDFSALTYEEYREELSISYKKILTDNDGEVILGRIKPIYFSQVLSRLGIYGFYSFLSGEVNLNTEIPKMTVPSTIAHEYAHSLGFSKEGDAEFISYLVCINSNYDFIKYSGNLSALRRILSDLSKKDGDLYAKVYKTLPNAVIFDIKEINEYNARYRDSALYRGSVGLNSIHLNTAGNDTGYSVFTAMIVEYRLGFCNEAGLPGINCSETTFYRSIKWDNSLLTEAEHLTEKFS